ncbi:MAG: nucleotidyltransferase domain-containing protein [Pseudomonadota bacterium]|nr:nucleotidyltransferase domain-containing protein [Pseudomonadota bacterium]
MRSLTSSVLRWPDRRSVEESLHGWLAREEGRHPELVRLGYFGSYARGDWGVGSDLDLIALVREADEPFERRALSWDLNPLPVPTELLVYTEPEWRRLLDTNSRFAETVRQQAVWVYP